jgi:hypothetical protein
VTSRMPRERLPARPSCHRSGSAYAGVLLTRFIRRGEAVVWRTGVVCRVDGGRVQGLVERVWGLRSGTMRRCRIGQGPRVVITPVMAASMAV